MEPYYKTDNEILYLGDIAEILNEFESNSIDLIFADPPYFLSNGGTTCKSGRRVSVNKGSWDRTEATFDRHSFNRQWLRLCRRVMKDEATIWISGTLHNIFSVGMALEEEGFQIINNITWRKTNPPPNLACRCFTHSTETILWAKKRGARHYFNYALMKELNGGKQMKDVWEGPITKQSEKKEGKHPTQKPLYLLERIILASSREGDLVLDPFCGSSTTGVACQKYHRRYIGIDNEPEYLALSQRRLAIQDGLDYLRGSH